MQLVALTRACASERASPTGPTETRADTNKAARCGGVCGEIHTDRARMVCTDGRKVDRAKEMERVRLLIHVLLVVLTKSAKSFQLSSSCSLALAAGRVESERHLSFVHAHSSNKQIVCLFDDDSEPPSALLLTLQVAPLVANAAVGETAFAIAYLPLAAIGYISGASPAISIILATLLYIAGATLSDGVQPLLPLACLFNVGIAAAILGLDESAALLIGEDEDNAIEDDFTAFDRRLEDALREKQAGSGKKRWWSR